MAELGEPRTLLEAIVRQRQLSWDEAADLVVKTARQHEAISISLSGRHLGRLARNERSGNRPNPATRRALQYTFNQPVDELLGPYAPDDLPRVDESRPDVEASEVLTVAADRARRFMTSLQTLSDESLQLIHDEVQDLVRAYPARPLPTDKVRKFFESPTISSGQNLPGGSIVIAVSTIAFTPATNADPLFPSAALLPLSDTRGGHVPLVGAPGPLRPLSAALGIAPIECGKHDTIGTRWYEDDPTQKSDDGKVVPDTVKILRTDT